MNTARLIDEISTAFAGVQLEDGDSLNMTEYYDSGDSAVKFLEAAKLDERNEWGRIPDSVLESFTVTFCFTDLKGFRFYIPAYMIWTIRNHRISDSIIADYTIYAIDPDRCQFTEVPFLDWFTPAQVNAMIAFLQFCSGEEDSLHAAIARQNLSKIEDMLANHRGKRARR